MSANIEDVAKLANVCPATVSRYMNGMKLRKHNSDRIESAIKELNYVPSIAGRALRKNQSMIVGFAIPSFNGNFMNRILAVIEEHISRSGYHLLPCALSGDPERVRAKLLFLKERGIDGLFVFPHGWEQHVDLFEDFQKNKLPIVAIDSQMTNLKSDAIVIDNYAAGQAAVRHLVEKGHKKIAIIGGREHQVNSENRMKGSVDVYLENGLKCPPAWRCYTNFSKEMAYEKTIEIFSQPDRPTAVFAQTFAVTLGTIGALNELKIKIPEEVSVVGFDQDMISSIIRPELTSIEQSTKNIALKAVEVMLDRIANKDKEQVDYQSISIPFDLVERDSVKTISS